MPSMHKELDRLEAAISAKEAEVSAKANGSNGTAEAERVNHPAHYQFPNGVEVIDLVEHLSFNRGNAVKYLARAGKKSAAEELDDLHKARWYCDREIQRIRNAQALIGGK